MFTDLFFNQALYGLFAAGFGLIIGIITVVLYIYYALVWQTIAKKLKYKYYWLAWIPIAQLFLFPILAKKKWGWGFLLLIPFLNILLYIIWRWEIYKRLKFPEWLSLMPVLYIIPIINIFAVIADLIIIGIAAWKK
jgi:hypothetical protein